MKRQELIDWWTAALESGEYRKGKNHLKRSGRYCCLGVLCEVATKAGIKGADVDAWREQPFTSEILPSKLAKFLNIDQQGRFKDVVEYGGEYYGSLVSLNDDGGVSFKQIAKIIREQWKRKNFETYE